MRMTRLLHAWTLGLALVLGACQAPPVAVTTSPLLQREDQSLRLRLVPDDGMRLLAVPAQRTLADVDRLEVHLQVKVDDAFVAIDATTGQPSPETSHPTKLVVEGTPDPGLVLTFDKLKAMTDYRILARAFDGDALISDDARSSVVVPVGNRQALDPVDLPLTIVTPFGAETQVSFSLWGATRRIAFVRASLRDPALGIVARLDVPFASLSKALSLAALRANTTYTLELEAFEAGSGTAIATASGLIPVSNDEAVPARSIPLSIKGDMKLPLDYYTAIALDRSGNLHAVVPRELNGSIQGAAELFRFAPTGESSKVYLPHRVDQIIAAGDGTRYVNTDAGPARVHEDGSETLIGRSATAMAADAAGNLFLASYFGYQDYKIYQYAPGLTETLVGGAFAYPRALAVAKDGSLYVADHENRNGTWVSSLWRMAPKPNPADGYEAPLLYRDHLPGDGVVFMAVDEHGTVYLRLSGIGDRFYRLQADGMLEALSNWDAWGVAVDAQNNVYVSDYSSRRVTVF